MSEHTTIDAATLDQFVDGELDRDAQRAVLTRLDDVTDGWRRLALAFVESQALGAELRGAADASRVGIETDATPGAAARGEFAASVPWSRVFSLAACLLICVGVGFGIGRLGRFGAEADTSGGTPSTEIAGVPTDPGDRSPTDQSTTDDPPIDAPTGMVTVHTHDGVPVRLPVYNVAYGGEDMLSSTESGVPEKVIRALRSGGHDVKQQRRLWPIDLGDGRQIIVPVDQLDVKYVGYDAYQ